MVKLIMLDLKGKQWVYLLPEYVVSQIEDSKKYQKDLLKLGLIPIAKE